MLVRRQVTLADAFTTLVIANLSLILTNRSWSRGLGSILRTPNAAMWWIDGRNVPAPGADAERAIPQKPRPL